MRPLDDVLQPIDQARGLPNPHYTSAEVYGAEAEALFFGGWAGLSFAADVPEPGEAVPVDFLGQPLVAVRDRDGTLRVFQNTCRHRGMILVAARKQVGGVLRCPYHSWCYALDGRLVTTPHVGGPGHNTHPGIDKGTLGLIEIRSHVWRGIVFVNLSGTAPPFEEVHRDLIARWAAFEGHPQVYGGADSVMTFDVACNWKLAVENYCESYHLPWVHPGLNSYSRLEDHYHIQADGRYSGQGTLVYRPMLSEDGRRFPDTPGLPPAWDAGAEYVALYPNVLLGQHRDHAFAILLEPRGPARTVERVALFYTADEVAGPAWAEMRAANTEMWHKVFEEDIFVVEGMQKGRAARNFDGGRFSPAMDGPTHCFHRWVAARMQAAVPRAAD
ncbi:aromatic ring-hydroxylating dioxygenase subunit alpha [Rhodobacteraceae bacterium CCMM004]|nr:aromatic ring-hydroxylating dioxygenase subunit alpha [Rhodobacteraceae bacterium CCMM004]